jgi:hypothetical protein
LDWKTIDVIESAPVLICSSLLNQSGNLFWLGVAVNYPFEAFSCVAAERLKSVQSAWTQADNIIQ